MLGRRSLMLLATLLLAAGVALGGCGDSDGNGARQGPAASNVTGDSADRTTNTKGSTADREAEKEFKQCKIASWLSTGPIKPYLRRACNKVRSGVLTDTAEAQRVACGHLETQTAPDAPGRAQDLATCDANAGSGSTQR